MKKQHSMTIPITENLVALMFVSLADLTQGQRQVLTSLMAHRNRPLADYRTQELREVYLEVFCTTRRGLPSKILYWLPQDMPAEKPSSSSTKATWTPMKDSGLRTKRMEPRDS